MIFYWKILSEEEGLRTIMCKTIIFIRNNIIIIAEKCENKLEMEAMHAMYSRQRHHNNAHKKKLYQHILDKFANIYCRF